MVSWSSLVRPALAYGKCARVFQSSNGNNALQLQLRSMGGHGHEVMNITPSRFQWNKFKDLLHYYILLGVIPISIIVMSVNIFVGPATLTEIPEGYTPKHWEYCRHPITRFLARYVYPSPQQQYEKALHHLYEENEKAQIRLLEKEIKQKMAELSDYQAYYYQPVTAKYHRISKQVAEELRRISGDE